MEQKIAREIMEKDYQKVKKKLNKKDDYFSLEELKMFYKILGKED